MATSGTPFVGRLTALQGTALYVGVVLGTGIVALPALAAQVAGPASLIAWIALVVLSAPLAATFAALGSRHPDAGGVATYARLGLGPRAAAVVGWCFFAVVPVGAPAAALWAGGYVAAALGGGGGTAAATAVALLLAAPAANLAGVHVTGRVQLALAAVLLAFLLVSVGLALPHARLANLHPFAPHGWGAVASATTLLVWSFVGWEAVTHLTAEFRHPRRDVPRATGAAVVVVGVLYVMVAFVMIAVLGPAAARSTAPLGDLMAVGLGGDGRRLAAVTAVLLTLGVMTTYYAGAAKLGAALARDGDLPSRLALGSEPGEVALPGLLLTASLALAAFAVVDVTGVGAAPLVRATTGLFSAVYAIAAVAALRLLPPGSPGRVAAVLALAGVAVLLVLSGPYLLCPVAVAGAALAYGRRVSTARRAAPRP